MDVFSADWLGICRRIVAAQRAIFAATPGSEERTVYEGVGEGGDRTLAIDRRCEDAVFAELERAGRRGRLLRRRLRGARRGRASAAAARRRVVIDPIDGSLNARRTIPSHSLSIAVASGPSMADVEFGFVYDFGAGEEFVARRGEGADARRRADRGRRRRRASWRWSGLESAEPEWALPALEALAGKVYRLRVVGSIAITAAYVGRRPLRRDAEPALLPLGRRRRRAADRPRGRGRRSPSAIWRWRMRRWTSTPATRSRPPATARRWLSFASRPAGRRAGVTDAGQAV